MPFQAILRKKNTKRLAIRVRAQPDNSIDAHVLDDNDDASNGGSISDVNGSQRPYTKSCCALQATTTNANITNNKHALQVFVFFFDVTVYANIPVFFLYTNMPIISTFYLHMLILYILHHIINKGLRDRLAKHQNIPQTDCNVEAHKTHVHALVQDVNTCEENKNDALQKVRKQTCSSAPEFLVCVHIGYHPSGSVHKYIHIFLVTHQPSPCISSA